MKRSAPSILIFLGVLATILLFSYGCGWVQYGFTDRGGPPPSVKTVRIQQFTNTAPYQNTRLGPELTDRVSQKINNQTRLTRTAGDSADWDISGVITDYSVSTSGVSSVNGRSQTSVNRLNVSVKVTVLDTKDTTGAAPREFTVSRQFDFGAGQSLQQAENVLLDEMIRNLADEIFNGLFSDW